MSRYKIPDSKKSVERITNNDKKETLENRIKKELCDFCKCKILLENFSIDKLISDLIRLEFFPGYRAYYNNESNKLTISNRENKTLRIVEFR